jgi:hypothetical protein
MKERLNLTIDGALLEAMKAYAAGKGMSVSELVESYFRQVTKPVQRQNILDMVDQLEGPDGRPGVGNGKNGEQGHGIMDDGVPEGNGGEAAQAVKGKEVKHGL